MTPPGTPVELASVVEGVGEVSALPKLLYRLAGEYGIQLLLRSPPMRVNRGKLIAAGGIERAVNATAQRGSSVLILIDADDDCPAQRGPELLKRAQQARADVRVAVVLAKCEFEAWFLAAASSLVGCQGLPDALHPPGDPETIRGAKEWLTRARNDGHPYKPTVDQAPLASAFDLAQARANSPSFGKFCRDVAWLLGAQPHRPDKIKV